MGLTHSPTSSSVSPGSNPSPRRPLPLQPQSKVHGSSKTAKRSDVKDLVLPAKSENLKMRMVMAFMKLWSSLEYRRTQKECLFLFLRTHKKITGLPAPREGEPGEQPPTTVAVEDQCTDISFYDVIQYTTKPKKCCDPSLRQVCAPKSETICEDVLELKCDVVAWVDCKTEPKTHPGTTCAVDIKDYEFMDCKEVKTSTKHTKPVADCKNITKNNCVTDWEVDAQGNKVWTGTETCTPVVWEECEVVEKTVEFPSIQTECQTAANIKWTDYEDREVDTLGMETTCEVKSATDCKDAQVNKCSQVTWQECKMEPFDECNDVFVYQPDQEKIHKQSCLAD